jgi:Putative Actinobacterial Holin-X, holin superfamily III
MTYRNPLRDIGALASDAVGHAANLVQLEFRLARTELKENVLAWKTGAILVLIGAVFAIAALFLVLQSLVVVIVAAGLKPEVAILIVAGGCLLVSAIFMTIGSKRLGFDALAPDRTVDQLSRDKNMVKEKLS